MIVMPTLCFSQQVLENSYLSINVPDGWEAQKMDVPDATIEMVYFCNKGESLYNMGFIYGLEQEQDPSLALQTQIDNRSNLIFSEAQFDKIRPSVFMGKKAMTVDFSTSVNNEKFMGAAYAFNENQCTIIIIGCYKVGVKSNLPQIWRSIHWKKINKKTKYGSLREELEAFTNGVNKLLSATTADNEDQQTLSITLAANEDCLEYKFRLLKIDKNDYSDEDIEGMKSNVRTSMPAVILQISEKTPLIKKCLDANYSFKYIFYDKNDNFLYAVKITPDNYKN